MGVKLWNLLLVEEAHDPCENLRQVQRGIRQHDGFKVPI